MVELRKPYVLIGRCPSWEKCSHPEPDDFERVVLDALDRSISRAHARLELTAQGYRLYNLSRNCTLINGRPVPRMGRLLYHGDRFEAGHAELLYFVSDARTPAEELDRQARDNEELFPNLALQLHYLSHMRAPENVGFAAGFLQIIKRLGRFEQLLDGATYGPVENFEKLAGHPEVCALLASAYLSRGDVAGARRVIGLARGCGKDERMLQLEREIENLVASTLSSDLRPQAQALPVFEREDLRIYVEDRADFGDLRFIERHYRYMRRQIDARFGLSPVQKVAFHVTDRDVMFARPVMGGRCLGYYSPSTERVYIRPRRDLRDEEMAGRFYEAVVHEYVHSRVHDLLKDRTLPRWYEEGLSQLASRNCPLSVFVRELRQRPDLHVPIHTLTDDAFRSDQAGIAYWASHAIVTWLADAHGVDSPFHLVVRMATTGCDFDVAFQHFFACTVVQIDDEWQTILRRFPSAPGSGG